MSNEDSQHGKIIQFPIPNRQEVIKKVLDRARQKSKNSEITKTVKKKSTPPKSAQVNVEGSNNVIAGGDMNVQGDVNIGPPPQKIVHKKFTPGPEHISAAQGKKIVSGE